MIPMIMRPYLTHGCSHPPFASRRYSPVRRYGRRAVHPDGNNVGGPSHAAYTGLYPRRRVGVIPPIIKLLSCGWHPRATRGTRPPFSSRPHSPCSPCSPLLSLYSSSRPAGLVRSFVRSFPPAFVLLSVRFSSILVDCPTRRARWLRDARERTIRIAAAEFLLAEMTNRPVPLLAISRSGFWILWRTLRGDWIIFRPSGFSASLFLRLEMRAVRVRSSERERERERERRLHADTSNCAIVLFFRHSRSNFFRRCSASGQIAIAASR